MAVLHGQWARVPMATSHLLHPHLLHLGALTLLSLTSEPCLRTGPQLALKWTLATGLKPGALLADSAPLPVFWTYCITSPWYTQGTGSRWPYVFAYNLLASYTSYLINANAILIVLYGIAYERGPRKTSLYMFSKTQPLQTTYVGCASRNVACFLSTLALSVVEMWMQNSGSLYFPWLPSSVAYSCYLHTCAGFSS